MTQTSRKPSWSYFIHVKSKKRLLWWRHLLRSTLDPDEQEKQRKLFTYFNNYRKSLFHTTNGVEENPRCPTRASSPPGVGAWRATSLPLLGTG